MDAAELRAAHEAAEHQPARVFRAPGRVNLVGEHTDYSGGFCMPAALHFETRIAASPRTGGQTGRRLKLRSIEFKETVEIDLEAPLLLPSKRHWSNYCLGVVWSLREAGFSAPGAALTITGDVPHGAGLSSSASLEVATAAALLGLAGETIPAPQLAQICQRAENEFVGAPCGIMDQFIAANGRQGSALILDTRALTFELAPIPEHLRLVIANSMVKHSLADGGAYALRRREVEEAAAAIAAYKAGAPGPAGAGASSAKPELRDATLADLEACAGQMSQAACKRARHVITDSQRVLDGLALLRVGDIAGFGRLLNAAHASYRDDFEASCVECDLLQEIGRVQPGCYGSRLTGGGFGGCVVNLVEAHSAERFAETVQARYLEQTGIRAEVYLCSTADGAGEVMEIA